MLLPVYSANKRDEEEDRKSSRGAHNCVNFVLPFYFLSIFVLHYSSGCCQTTNPHYSWPSAAKMELISETLKRSLKLHQIKRTDKDRGCKTLCISHHSLTLTWVCLGLSEHSLTEKVSYWLMIFLSLSGIFICVQSCASISTLAPGSAMSPWLCRTLPDFRIIYFMVRFGWANITHSFIDLKEEGPEGGRDILLEQP